MYHLSLHRNHVQQDNDIGRYDGFELWVWVLLSPIIIQSHLIPELACSLPPARPRWFPSVLRCYGVLWSAPSMLPLSSPRSGDVEEREDGCSWQASIFSDDHRDEGLGLGGGGGLSPIDIMYRPIGVVRGNLKERAREASPFNYKTRHRPFFQFCLLECHVLLNVNETISFSSPQDTCTHIHTRENPLPSFEENIRFCSITAFTILSPSYPRVAADAQSLPWPIKH